jgi:excisionase family DNA binding protein
VQSNQEPLPPTALPLYTVADAAEALGVSLNYMYERIRDNRMATVNLGTDNKPKLRVRADTLQSFIQERTTAGAA